MNKKLILHLCADLGSDSRFYQLDDNYEVVMVGEKIGVEKIIFLRQEDCVRNTSGNSRTVKPGTSTCTGGGLLTAIGDFSIGAAALTTPAPSPSGIASRKIREGRRVIMEKIRWVKRGQQPGKECERIRASHYGVCVDGATGPRKARAIASFGSVETGWSRHNHRIISGKIAPPCFCPWLPMPHA